MEPKVFRDLVTFTRSTTGTFLNFEGRIETAAIDAPRLEFDASGAPRGLLFEQQRTNIALQSGDFANAAWTKSGATVPATAVIAPDGSLAVKLTESAANTTHLVSQAGKVLTGSTKYCRYAFAKADGSGRMLYLETDSFAQWVNSGSCRYNLDAGVIDLASPGLDAVGMIPYPNGWYLCYLVATTVASPVAVPFDVQLATSAGPSYLGDGTSGAYIWHAQLEAGDGPSSPISTAAAQVTRAADLAFVPAAAWLKTGEGTLLVEVAHSALVSVVAVSLGTSAPNPSVRLLTNASGVPRAEVVDDAGGVSFNPNLGATIVPGVAIKQAIAYRVNDFQFSTAGLVTPQDTSGDLPTIDRLALGARGVSSNHMQGYLRRIRYYPRRLTAAELQALTS